MGSLRVVATDNEPLKLTPADEIEALIALLVEGSTDLRESAVTENLVVDNENAPASWPPPTSQTQC